MVLYNNGEILDATSVEDKNIGAFYSFEFDDDKELMAKVGISYVSIEQARKNLDAEIPEYAFEEIKTAAKEEWNKQLSVVEVKGGTKEEKTIFYTALYHSLILPYVSNDVDGKYRSFVTNDSRILPFSERPKTNGAYDPFKILRLQIPHAIPCFRFGIHTEHYIHYIFWLILNSKSIL